MQTIKQYGGEKRLRKYRLFHHSADSFFYKLGISKLNIQRLIIYLFSNDNAIEIDECFDSQSGRQGFHFYINDVSDKDKLIDLSSNGYCFSDKALSFFLDKNNC